LDSISSDFEKQPIIEARVRHTLGKSFEFLGDLQISLEQIRRALELRNKHLGPENRESLVTLLALANVQGGLEQDKEALEGRELAFNISKKHFGLGDHVTQMAMCNLASSYEKFNRDDDALAMREQVLKLTQQHRKEGDP